MFDILKKIFNKKNKPSKDIAKDRLKLVLLSEKNNCPPEMLNQLREEIIKVLGQHFKLNPDEIEITISQENDYNKSENINSSFLVANIPLKIESNSNKKIKNKEEDKNEDENNELNNLNCELEDKKLNINEDNNENNEEECNNKKNKNKDKLIDSKMKNDKDDKKK